MAIYDESKRGPFIKERQEKSLQLDAVAEEFYREQWDVSKIFDLERFEPPEDPDERTAIHYLDYCGIDKLVVTETEFIFVAQRFRPHVSGDDFSLQVDNGTSRPSEYEKYLSAIEGVGNYPAVYAFGNVNEAGDGFEEFVLIDTEKFLTKLSENSISGKKPFDPGGSSAMYFPLTVLRRHNCILQSWGTAWDEDKYEHPLDGYSGPTPFDG